MFFQLPTIVRYFLAIFISFLSTILSFIIIVFIISLFVDISISELMLSLNTSGEINISALRILLFAQTTHIFGVFPLIFLSILFKAPFSFLQLKTFPQKNLSISIVAIMILAIPVINLMAELNTWIIDFVAGPDNAMKQMELAAERLTKTLLSDTSINGLIVNLIIVAVLPSVCEEIFFRGALLNVLNSYMKNHHLAIIISGVIFSLFHWQFYGFIPRAVMGIFFGYLLVYSKSLWLPILAHFVNNALAVIVYFFINKGMIDESVEKFGSTSWGIMIAIICSAILFYFIKNLYINNVEKRIVNDNT
jgi:uncharacterized protein